MPLQLLDTFELYFYIDADKAVSGYRKQWLAALLQFLVVILRSEQKFDIFFDTTKSVAVVVTRVFLYFLIETLSFLHAK